MRYLWDCVFWTLSMAGCLVLNFLFCYAWNHSLRELWPETIPALTYWQGYLLLVVANMVLPYKIIAALKDR